MIKIIFLGDIAGKTGRDAVAKHLPTLRKEHGLDFVVANAENMAGNGSGITHETLKEIYTAGVDAVTLGNHMFRQKDIETILPSDRRVLRPLNFTKDIQGEGFRVFTLDSGVRIGVVNLYGSVWMPNKAHCPFDTSRKFFFDYRLGVDYDAMIVDFHAEPTSEKQCLGELWDGKASLFVGTHTHTPSADTRIKPKGTAFQTDAGMCGDYESSLGDTFESSLPLFESSKHRKREVATGEATLCGVYVEVNEETGKAENVQAFRYGGCLEQKPISANK